MPHPAHIRAIALDAGDGHAKSFAGIAARRAAQTGRPAITAEIRIVKSGAVTLNNMERDRQIPEPAGERTGMPRETRPHPAAGT
jgi:hypothetical protein